MSKSVKRYAFAIEGSLGARPVATFYGGALTPFVNNTAIQRRVKKPDVPEFLTAPQCDTGITINISLMTKKPRLRRK